MILPRKEVKYLSTAGLAVMPIFRCSGLSPLDPLPGLLRVRMVSYSSFYSLFLLSLMVLSFSFDKSFHRLFRSGDFKDFKSRK